MSNGAPPPVPGSAPAKKGLSPLAWIAIGCGGLVVVGFAIFLILGALVFKKGKEVVAEATGSESVGEFLDDLQEDPAKTLAETAVRGNPDLDLVSTDDEAGTVTFRNNRTGEEATLNFEDIAEGRFSMTIGEGEYRVDASDSGEGGVTFTGPESGEEVVFEATGEGGFSMTTDEGEYRIDASESGEGGVTFTGPEGETRIGASADLSDVPGWVPAYPGVTDPQSTMHTTSANGVMGTFTGTTSDDAQKVLDHFVQVFEDKDFKIGQRSMTKTGNGSFGAITGELGDGRSVNVGIIESAGNTQVTINYNQKKQ